LDIMDYIHPGTCTDEAFRLMWAEFEWENKVAINTTITDLTGFLNHVVTNTNMTCLTPLNKEGGKSTFLAANLYAKSIFGEDALVNVSVEKKEDADGKLTGYIRIRSKTQVHRHLSAIMLIIIILLFYCYYFLFFFTHASLFLYHNHSRVLLFHWVTASLLFREERLLKVRMQRNRRGGEVRERECVCVPRLRE
jgi:hypothetical protein